MQCADEFLNQLTLWTAVGFLVCVPRCRRGTESLGFYSDGKKNNAILNQLENECGFSSWLRTHFS